MLMYYFLTVDGDIVFCSQERGEAEARRDAEQERLIRQECAARDLRYPEDAERAMESVDVTCHIVAVSEKELKQCEEGETVYLSDIDGSWEENFSCEELLTWIPSN